jgi:hypothetical protein
MRVLDKEIYNVASTATSTQSVAIDAEHVVGLSVQVDWSANSGTATATLQASNDGIAWIALPNTVSITGASGMDMLYATDFWYRHVRVDLNVSSAVSNVKLHIITKGQ